MMDRLLATMGPDDHIKTVDVLQRLCCTLADVVKRQLPDRKFGDPNEELKLAARATASNNISVERGFGKIDNLTKTKPNATCATIEATVMFQSNLTLQWLLSKDSHAQQVLQEKAKKMTRSMHERGRQRDKDVRTKVIEKLHTRRTLLEESEEKQKQTGVPHSASV